MIPKHTISVSSRLWSCPTGCHCHYSCDISCAWLYMCEQASSSVTSNFPKVSKHTKKKKTYVHLSCFSPQRRNDIHQSAIHQFLSPVLSSSATPKPQKGKLLVLFWKIVLRKKWFQPAQPFVFPLNKASDKAGAWCTSVEGARARSRVHKQSHVSRQTECSLQSPRHPDENIMFYST